MKKSTFITKITKLLAVLLAFTLALSMLPGCVYAGYQFSPEDIDEVYQGPVDAGPRAAEVRSLGDIGKELFGSILSSDFTIYHQLVADPANFDFGDGFVQPEPTFGDYSFEAAMREARYNSELLLEVKSRDASLLEPNDLRLYNYLVNYLESSLALVPYFYLMDPYEPSTGFHIQVPLSLMTHSFRSVQDIDDYLVLLKDVPRILDQANVISDARTSKGIFPNLAAVESTIEEAEIYIAPGSSNILVASFEDSLYSGEWPFSELTAEELAHYADLNREIVETLVIPAYSEAIALLEEIATQTSYEVTLPSLPNAKGYFETYMRLYGFYETPEQAIATLDENLDILFGQVMQGIFYFDFDLWDRVAVETLPEEASAKIEFFNARVNEHFPEIGMRPFIVEAASDDEVMKAFAAFYLLAPVDDLTQNRIVYYPQNITPGYSLGLVLSHETFPGHLYQYNYFGLSDPHPIEQLLGTTAYAEGWAVYSEYYALLYMGLNEEEAQVAHSFEVFTYALQARIDLGINYEGWDLEATTSYLSQWGFASLAEDIFLDTASTPLLMLPYGLGPLEFLDLLSTAQYSLGDAFDIKEFHSVILQDGELPLALLRKNVNAWLEQ